MKFFGGQSSSQDGHHMVTKNTAGSGKSGGAMLISILFI
jgi:hypothetical protein